MKVALVIGHSRKKQGARNKHHEISEFMFNEFLADKVAIELTKKGIESEIVYRGFSYWFLPGKVNRTNADIAVSMHCNAFNEGQNGTETLYYKNSVNGSVLASFMQDEIVNCLGLKDRGLKPCIEKHKGKAGDKGGHLLKKTKMPCVIVEPFFIDCDASLMLGMAKTNELAVAYANGIESYFDFKDLTN
jgi:N-acetylmuramoyl-L-alanine amidase